MVVLKGQSQEPSATTHAAFNAYSGIERAKTGESDALAGDSEGGANDGTVGVAQYVMPPTLQGSRGRVKRETEHGHHDLTGRRNLADFRFLLWLSVPCQDHRPLPSAL